MQVLKTAVVALRANLFNSMNFVSCNVNLLRPCVQPLVAAINHQQIRGLKHKDMLTLRCPDCYFKKVEDDWYVLCPTWPRHKQIERKVDIRDKWLVTHRTRRGKPFMKKEEAYIIGTCPPGPFDYRMKVGQRLRIRRKYLHPTMEMSPPKDLRKFKPNIVIGMTRIPPGVTNPPPK